ncbi:MAG: MFS transporter, partial [Nitrospirae bacterium]
PRQILAWCLYDFANSSYSAVVAAVVFPVYFSREIALSPSEADLWWGMAISVSMALVALTSPFMGGLSDYGSKRRPLLFLYTLSAVLATGLLFLPEKGQVGLAFLLILIANFSTEGALVFYNAYLGEIAPPDRRGRVSGWGFGLGYVGSVISLLVALYLIREGYSRMVWPFVALFFLVFSLPAFFFLPPQKASSLGTMEAGKRGVRLIWSTFKEAIRQRKTRRFLIAYFLYKDAINTIIVFSSLFALNTLGFPQKELVLLYLLIQVSAALGAFFFSLPTDRWGAWRVLMLSLLVWIILSGWTYFLKDKSSFWVVAFLGGAFLGVVQSASRAFFCKFIPAGREGEYFGI